MTTRTIVGSADDNLPLVDCKSMSVTRPMLWNMQEPCMAYSATSRSTGWQPRDETADEGYDAGRLATTSLRPVQLARLWSRRRIRHSTSPLLRRCLRTKFALRDLVHTHRLNRLRIYQTPDTITVKVMAATLGRSLYLGW